MNPIGVLALQGDFQAHRAALDQAGSPSLEVRHARDLDRVSALIIPGGESTTLVKLVQDMGLAAALRDFGASGRPVLGTCAGAILLAARVRGSSQFCLGLLDIDIERNAYGRQRESFETAQGVIEEPGEWGNRGAPLEMVFIRAPRISRVGSGVRLLARHGEDPVLVRQGNILAATFHPEMGRDRTLHRLVASMVQPAFS